MRFERRLVRTEADLRPLLERIANHAAMGMDTESDGPLLVDGWRAPKKDGTRSRKYKTMINVYRSTTVGMSFAFLDGTSWYVPFQHRKDNVPLPFIGRIGKAMSVRKGRMGAHNLKHEIQALRRPPVDVSLARLADLQVEGARSGIPGEDVWLCTMVGMWLLGKAGHDGKYGLKSLAPKYLGLEMTSFEETTGGLNFGEIPPEKGLNYACEDAEAALRLQEEIIIPGLEANPDGLLEWYLDVEMPTVFMLRDMEDAGLGMDADQHHRTLDEYGAALDSLYRLWDFETDGLGPDGGSINPNSSQQLQALFERKIWSTAGIPKKATGYSTEAEYIRDLARALPEGLGRRLAGIKLEISEISKLVGTYGVKLLDIAQQYPDQRLHGGTLQTGTRTGRFASSYPNLQNFPIRTERGKEIRRSFAAREGRVLVSADYSQIDLRLMAHFAGEGRLFEGYKAGRDVHQETADLISGIVGFGVERAVGKKVNFSKIYGAGPKRLAKDLGYSLPSTKLILEAHAKAHGEIDAMLDRASNVGRRRGYVRTLGGRRRVVEIDRWQGELDRLRAEGHRYKTSAAFREAWYEKGREERKARNTPIQGGAGDIVKIGMLNVWRRTPGDILMMIHDDVILETDEASREDTMHSLQEELERAGERFGLRVPLVAEPASGKTLADL